MTPDAAWTGTVPGAAATGAGGEAATVWGSTRPASLARWAAYCQLRHYGMSPSLAFLLSQAGFGSPSVASFFGGV